MNNSFYKQHKSTTGFPNPAKDYDLTPLDLNSHLITHPSSTFIMRVEGIGLAKAGIFKNDLVIVDRSITPTNNTPVVATLDNEFKIAIYLELDQRKYLWRNKLIVPDEDSSIWGVVIHTIHSYKNKL